MRAACLLRRNVLRTWLLLPLHRETRRRIRPESTTKRSLSQTSPYLTTLFWTPTIYTARGHACHLTSLQIIDRDIPIRLSYVGDARNQFALFVRPQIIKQLTIIFKANENRAIIVAHIVIQLPLHIPSFSRTEDTITPIPRRNTQSSDEGASIKFHESQRNGSTKARCINLCNYSMRVRFASRQLRSRQQLKSQVSKG